MLCILFCFPLKAQVTFPVNGPTDPRHITYAFTNAVIQVDWKTRLDSATLLIRDGIITDVGAGIVVPSDAVVTDLEGKYIYPSLIDIFSDYGLPEISRNRKPDDDEGSPQFLSNTKGAYGWNQAIRAEYDAGRNFKADPKTAAEWRELGFGAVNTVNKDGIVRGTSVLALLGDGKENDLIITGKAAASYSFNKGTSTQDYPNSLMGAIALLRQTWLDAQWYKNGGYKKEFNITLDAFNNMQELPQIFDAGDQQNEFRADKIGEEFGAQFIIKSSGHEYERIKDFSRIIASYILPLNFPETYDISDPYDALNISLQDMKRWELAPTNPGVLEREGLNFAITPSDLKNKKDFWKNIRLAIENGLSESQALKSLTAVPANLLRAGDKLGGIKKGMIANFLITSLPLFNKDMILYDNWIKGVRYPVHDFEAKDIRGNYSLRMGKYPPVRMKVTGIATSPDFIIYDDTLPVKISSAREAGIRTLSFTLKHREPLGLVRLTGTESSGDALLPDGSWTPWSLSKDSSAAGSQPKDSISPRKATGMVWYPDMAYGWKKLPEAHTVLFEHATVWTNEAEGILKDASVLVENGKIKAVGNILAAPEGCEIIDATGKHLTSGIIDEHSHIAVSGAVNEATQASSAEVRIGDVIDAEDINIYRQLAGGVTVSHILHGSANPIGGQTQLIKLRWGQSPEKMKFSGWPGFIKFALGENVKQSNWGDRQVTRYPQSRMGVEQVFRDYFTRAKEYDRLRKIPGAAVDGIPLRRDLELEAIAEVLNGKRFITCHSYEQSEINMLMHLADTFGFRINTFGHILEGYKVADKMKAHGVLGVSTFSDWWAYKFEVYEAIPYNGAIMHDEGLTVAYNSDDAEMARRLNQEAAKAVKYGGVSEEEAWKFVTLNPAKMLRVDSRVGSIKAGKDADLVLWDHDPLSIYAKPLKTFIDGICYFDEEHDREMRKAITEERARIAGKMTDARNSGESLRKPTMKMHTLKYCTDEETQVLR